MWQMNERKYKYKLWPRVGNIYYMSMKVAKSNSSVVRTFREVFNIEVSASLLPDVVRSQSERRL